MDFSEFEALAGKVEQAVAIIEGLKRERDSLHAELHLAMEKAGNLEQTLAHKEEELQAVKMEAGDKEENIHKVGQRIRDMVLRLDTALA